MLNIGDKVNITQEAWQKFLSENQMDLSTPIPISQVITDMPSHSPFSDRFMLSFPMYWWSEDDLVLVEKLLEYEEVSSILVNGHHIMVGDMLSCQCTYEVIKLHPIWHSTTRRHISDHKSNTFGCKLIKSAGCPIHYTLNTYQVSK